jgi:hypothetical protein
MSRHNPESIVTTDACTYGCGEIANYKFKSGKLCCSSAIQKCKGHIQKSLATKRATVDESGLNSLQRGQIAAHKVKLESGGYVRAGQSISNAKNRILPTGEKQCDVSNRKMRETKLTIGDDGLTNAQRSARKMANNRLVDIDESGLNQYERWTLKRVQEGTFDNGFEKALRIKHDADTGIRYQGLYELDFLQQLKLKYGIEWVKNNVQRGPSIQYIDYYGKKRWYLSDFIIGNTVYEIKSNWTWNKRGKDLITEQNNINKLTATVEAGFKVKLIREGKEIDYAIETR